MRLIVYVEGKWRNLKYIITQGDACVCMDLPATADQARWTPIGVRLAQAWPRSPIDPVLLTLAVAILAIDVKLERLTTEVLRSRKEAGAELC